MQLIRFLPTDEVPPAYRNPMPVETIPVKGDHVYLNGVHFVVESHSYFFQGGIGGPPSPVLVNLLKTEALYEEPAR